MPIGTSLGAYHEDDFAHVAAPWMDMGDKDNNIITPNQAETNKQLDQVEMSELGGIQVANTIDTPVDSAATMAAGASEKAADALKRGRGTKPTSDVDTGLEGRVYYQGKYGSITNKDIDTGMDVAMSVSAGGLKTEKIKSAALQYKGDIYEGGNHGIALMNLESKFGKNRVDVESYDWSKVKDGFTTTHGRFVSREEAMDIAKKNEQISPQIANEPSNTWLLSEDLQ